MPAADAPSRMESHGLAQFSWRAPGEARRDHADAMVVAEEDTGATAENEMAKRVLEMREALVRLQKMRAAKERDGDTTHTGVAHRHAAAYQRTDGNGVAVYAWAGDTGPGSNQNPHRTPNGIDPVDDVIDAGLRQHWTPRAHQLAQELAFLRKELRAEQAAMRGREAEALHLQTFPATHDAAARRQRELESHGWLFADTQTVTHEVCGRLIAVDPALDVDRLNARGEADFDAISAAVGRDIAAIFDHPVYQIAVERVAPPFVVCFALRTRAVDADVLAQRARNILKKAALAGRGSPAAERVALAQTAAVFNRLCPPPRGGCGASGVVDAGQSSVGAPVVLGDEGGRGTSNDTAVLTSAPAPALAPLPVEDEPKPHPAAVAAVSPAVPPTGYALSGTVKSPPASPRRDSQTVKHYPQSHPQHQSLPAGTVVKSAHPPSPRAQQQQQQQAFTPRPTTPPVRGRVKTPPAASTSATAPPVPVASVKTPSRRRPSTSPGGGRVKQPPSPRAYGAAAAGAGGATPHSRSSRGSQASRGSRGTPKSPAAAGAAGGSSSYPSHRSPAAAAGSSRGSSHVVAADAAQLPLPPQSTRPAKSVVVKSPPHGLASRSAPAPPPVATYTKEPPRAGAPNGTTTAKAPPTSGYPYPVAQSVGSRSSRRASDPAPPAPAPPTMVKKPL